MSQLCFAISIKIPYTYSSGNYNKNHHNMDSCYDCFYKIMNSPILEIKDLVKIYDKGKQEKLALEGVSLSIPRGSFFGLLGPNGAGKSTIIHCITGITQPTSGQILVDGTDVVKEYKLARTKVGLSPQEFNVDIFATPDELMDYIGGYYGIREAERKTRIDELIKRFSLEEHRNVRFQKLSGGLKRRVMLGRALVHMPDLLILDEPTAGVDVEQRHDLWKYLKEINDSGTTIILTSHYLEEIEHLCKDIAIINHGQIVAQNTKDEFMKNGESLEEVYLRITRKAKSEINKS
jgi:ABC-2 type transport system ATP-binding protein